MVTGGANRLACKNNFGIIWDICIVSDTWIYGNVNFIIQGEILPRTFVNNLTLQVVLPNLRNCFKEKYYPAGSDGSELGDREVDYNKLDYGEEPNIFDIETSELGSKFGKDCYGNCLRLSMGYSGNEERLFYSDNFGETYREVRMPKGTVENIIMQLPTYQELKNMIVLKDSS